MTLVPSETTVGFVGLGNMGRPMAGRLAAAGFRLLVHDVSAQAVDAFCQDCPQAVPASPAELVAQADVVVLILPTGKIVRDFLLSPLGTDPCPADLMRPGSIVVDMSSSAPVGTRALAGAMARRGLHMVDAPVSGGVVRARNGTLAVMTGGDSVVVDRLKPLFAAMCGPQVHVGAQGAGHAMKALNNYVSAAGLMAACEALRAAQRFGIDGQRAVDALNSSSGRSNSTETKLAQFVLSESYASGFSAGLMNKDLGIALDLFQGLGLRAPLAHAFVPLWSEATEALGPGADHTAIARLADALRSEGGGKG